MVAKVKGRRWRCLWSLLAKHPVFFQCWSGSWCFCQIFPLQKCQKRGRRAGSSQCWLWVGFRLPFSETAVGLLFQKPGAAGMAKQAARTASASWWMFEVSSVNPHSAGVTYPPSPCVWSVMLSHCCHFWCADQEVPFLDIQLCLDSSGGQLVPRK